ncbi:MAG: hypothetical protein ABH884_03540 [Candidatus Komeilibacteria bacterium]
MKENMKSIVVMSCLIVALWFFHFLFRTIMNYQMTLPFAIVAIIFMWLFSVVIEQFFIFGTQKALDYTRIIFLTLSYASLYLIVHIDIVYGDFIMKYKPLSLTELSWLSTLVFVILIMISFNLTDWLTNKINGTEPYHDNYY